MSLIISKLFLYILFHMGVGGGGGGGDVTGREQPQGHNVTLTGPKSQIGRSGKSHKDQNAILECYNSPRKGPVTRKMFPFDDVIREKCLGFPGGPTERI